MSDFSQRLKQLRKRHGVTQETLAKALGITRPHMNAVENSPTAPHRKLILAICHFFEVPSNYFDVGNEAIEEKIRRFLKAQDFVIYEKRGDIVVGRSSDNDKVQYEDYGSHNYEHHLLKNALNHLLIEKLGVYWSQLSQVCDLNAIMKDNDPSIVNQAIAYYQMLDKA